MKVFSFCPKCKNPMLNEELPRVGGNCWRVSCDKRLNHEILFLTVAGQDALIESLNMAIVMTSDKHNRVYAEWNFVKEELTITKGWLGSSFFVPNEIVPFFEPDFSKYDKLIKKLRTYLTFS